MNPPTGLNHAQETAAAAADATSGSADDEVAFVADALRSEAQAIMRIVDRLETAADGGSSDEGRRWVAAVDLLAGCKGHVVVCGMGKSGLIGAKISATLSSLGQPSSVVHPAEAVHGDLGRIQRDDVVMLLSYSGQTEEVINLAAILQADNVPRLGISCSHDTTLARLSSVHLSIGDITEACPLRLAPTCSTTATLAVGDALALAVSRRRSFDENDFQRHHPGGLLGAGLRPVSEVLRFKVGDNLPVVNQNKTVGEALDEAAADRRTGAIVLVDDDGRLTGIFTDADLRRLIRSDRDGLNRPIADVMTRHPKHLVSNDLVRDAVRLVRERRVDEIPVIDDDGRPIGLVDVQDLIAMKVVRE